MGLGLVVGGTVYFQRHSAKVHPLSEYRILHRCYSMLTGKYLAPDSPYIHLLKTKQKHAIDICNDLITMVHLDDQGYAKSRNQQNDLATIILQRFHLLHQSWFSRVGFTLADMEYPTSSVIDLQVGGNYWTWLLFSEGKKAKDIFSINSTPKALRTPSAKEQWLVEYHPVSKKITSRSSRPWTIQSGKNSALTWQPEFVPTGKLQGISLSELRSPAENRKHFQVPTKSFGGGILGTQSYLMSNTNLYPFVRSDGAMVSNRRFSESIIRDFFCRQLPVLKEEDVIAHVTPNPSMPLQSTPVCMKCHYTMEPLASGIRNLVTSYTGTDYKNSFNSRVFHQIQPTLAEKMPLMLEKGDVNFANHKPEGQLNFRNVDGEFVQFDFSSLDELGNFIGQTKDFHYCVAKRYVQYFTGYDFSVTTKRSDSPQAEEFIAIADKFFAHGRQKDLIRDIFSSSLFTQEISP